ncbi:MAG: thioredoxin family protein [Bacteroidetes bacterium]|nr:thioredoxin family protein [Bacteroidota bacterium]GDX47977.1 thioredoxin family protein [Bacteroidota bacterium]
MKKLTLLFALLCFFTIIKAQNTTPTGYQVGDYIEDFSLKNVDGRLVSLSTFPESFGFIIIFTCNHCPYSIAYEDRIIALNNKYNSLGYPVIAINPNDPQVQPGDSYEKMQERHKEKAFNFPYLFDDGQKVFPKFGAQRTPHVYIVRRNPKGMVVEYIGAIDDNYEDASAVKKRYVENAVDALIAGNKVEVNYTKAIGCSIKVKK